MQHPTLYFWQSIEDGLHELHRVLVPGGRLVLAVRTRRPGAGGLDPSRYGLAAGLLRAVMDGLESVGFREISLRQREIGRETIATIIALRP